jgi:hypothetical protein
MVDLSIDPEETPRQKHLKRLNAEAAERKRNKKEPIKTEYEMVYDTRGKPKYRKVFFMANGNKYRVPISKGEVRKLKEQKKIK